MSEQPLPENGSSSLPHGESSEISRKIQTPAAIKTPSDFHSLILSNSGIIHLSLSPTTTPNTPLFTIKESIFSGGKSHSITLSSTSSQKIFGVVNKTHKHTYAVGIGDPEANPQDTDWEELKNESTWKSHVFTWQLGKGGERKRFEWMRRKPRSFRGTEELVLREKVDGGNGEGEGEVWGCFKWFEGLKGKEWGVIWVRKSGKKVIGDVEKWSELELLILLTGLIVVLSLGGVKGRESGLWLGSYFS